MRGIINLAISFSIGMYCVLAYVLAEVFNSSWLVFTDQPELRTCLIILAAPAAVAFVFAVFLSIAADANTAGIVTAGLFFISFFSTGIAVLVIPLGYRTAQVAMIGHGIEKAWPTMPADTMQQMALWVCVVVAIVMFLLITFVGAEETEAESTAEEPTP